jgi:hypothetical protein
MHACCDLGVNLPRTGTDRKCERTVHNIRKIQAELGPEISLAKSTGT